MKHIMLPVGILLCCLILYTTITCTSAKDPSPDWNYIASETPGECFCVIQTSDGGYAVCGIHYLLAKFNSTGDLEWQKTFDGQQWHIAFKLIQTTDGGYALTGDGSSFNFVKTDAQGNLQWTSSLLDSTGEMLCGHDMMQTNDGGYLVVGSTDALSTDWLVKTDKDGSVEWNKTCNVGAAGELGVQLSISAVAEDTYLVSGNLGLVKIDINGSILWVDREVGGIAVTASDGGYLIMNSSKTIGCLTKVNSEGNISWSRSYSQVKDQRGVTFQQVAATCDGGCVVCGLAGLNEKQLFGNQVMGLYYFAQVTKVDATGNVEWSNLYEAKGPPFPSQGNYANSVIAVGNGGIVFAGRSGGYPWLVKFTDQTLAEQSLVSSSPKMTELTASPSNITASLMGQWSFAQATIAMALTAIVVALVIVALLIHLRKR